jgi:dCTP deaminase
MDTHPCKDWLPGALNKEQIEHLAARGVIKFDQKDEIGIASVDLSISDQGFAMEGGSIKPSRHRKYSEVLRRRLDLSQGFFELQKTYTYVLKLGAQLNPEKVKQFRIYGQATAKSTIGRVDVLARLIVDGMDRYECFEADNLDGNGEMYVEVTPITFNIKIKPGSSITQLRLFYGDPEDSEIEGEEVCMTVLRDDSGNPTTERRLTLDLQPDTHGGLKASAFRAKPAPHSSDFIDLSSRDLYEPWKYWQFCETDSENRLQIKSGRFYILRSKEKLWLPEGVATYCKASDETIGEMRIHYAGFVHPHFGTDKDGKQIPTPLIFEVRGHQVDAKLTHGEKMANLVFYRMSRNATHEGKDSYSGQRLQLSKVFRSWPQKLIKIDNEGNVEPT